jgi:hypothetical protein
MAKTYPQLSRVYDVVVDMSSVDQRGPSHNWDEKRKPEVIAMPRPYEGVRHALLGSFGAIPSMPQEFLRLLERLR